jgi:NAD(P)-dependent dehydrogenase (short-subunit alcohol dehydrogenase family)
MSKRLAGKRVVLTGAAANIGRATTLLFADEGAQIVIGDIDERAAETAAEAVTRPGNARFVRTDVGSPDDIERLMAVAATTMGGIDVIVNNAGIQRAGPVTEFPADEWDLVMAINARSCFFGAKYGVPHLCKAGGGVIINTASLAGVKGVGPGLSAYSASKGAIVALSKALAVDLAPLLIRVNALCPGFVDTPFNQPAIDVMGGLEKQREVIQTVVPLRRQAVAEEVAEGMLFLASDMSSYMTGHALVMDGGVSG